MIKEHFEELLNPTDPSSMVEAELEDDGGSSLISLGEVTEVVKQLHSGKAPGVDEIHPEMLKALGVEGLSWLTRLINIAWKSGAVPKEWQTGWWFPCLKKGTRGCVPIIEASHYSASPGKYTLRSLTDSRT